MILEREQVEPLAAHPIKVEMPKIRFLHPSPEGFVAFDPDRLESLVPLDRPSSQRRTTPAITYRSYLETIKSVLLNNWDQVIAAVADRNPRLRLLVQEVWVVAEKHGSDYHPARILLRTGESAISFVINVALTHRGIERMRQDFKLLSFFRETFALRFVPQPYFLVECVPLAHAIDDRTVSMFLAEWLEGFHEFHLSEKRGGEGARIVLWDPEKENRALSSQVTREIYRQTAFILTYYHDVESLREIFPWHHAAGDFVASVDDDRVLVKLVTVRQYAPRTTFQDDSSRDMAQALLFFLANLTLRNRLDRLDGIGDIAWAEAGCVDATLQGFLDGLLTKSECGGRHSVLAEEFAQYLRSTSTADLAKTFRFVVDSYDAGSPEMPVIRDRLADHIFEVYKSIQGCDRTGRLSDRL